MKLSVSILSQVRHKVLPTRKEGGGRLFRCLGGLCLGGFIRENVLCECAVAGSILYCLLQYYSCMWYCYSNCRSHASSSVYSLEFTMWPSVSKTTWADNQTVMLPSTGLKVIWRYYFSWYSVLAGNRLILSSNYLILNSGLAATQLCLASFMFEATIFVSNNLVCLRKWSNPLAII